MLSLIFASLIAHANSVELYQRVASEGARIKEIRLEQQAQREALRTEIKDERKEKIVENVLDRFAFVNEKWTSHWLNTLDRLSKVLNKLEEKFGASSEITSAQAAVDSAHKIVDAQAEKVYEIEIVDDESVGQHVRSLIAEFKSDMKVARDAVQNAKDEVREAFTTLKGTNDEE